MRNTTINGKMLIVFLLAILMAVTMPVYAFAAESDNTETSEINFTIEGGVMRWDLIEGAESYMIRIYGYGFKDWRMEADGTGAYDVDAKIDSMLGHFVILKPAEDNYILQIEAYDENHKKIAIGSIIYHYESALGRMVLSARNGMLTWDPVEGADSYVVYAGWDAPGVRARVGEINASDFVSFDIDSALEKKIVGSSLDFEVTNGDDYDIVVGALDKDGVVIGSGSKGSYYYRVKAGWHKDEKGEWYYYGTDGHRVTMKWMKDSKGWLFLGPTGCMITNSWAEDSKGICWLGPDGYFVEETKWIRQDDRWYYIKSGYMAMNQWQKDSKGWMYLGPNGTPVTNTWQKDSHGWCYLGEDGYMVTKDWAKDSKGWCWIGSDGHMVEQTKWLKTDGYWYHITNGYRDQSKWIKDSKGWCYLGADGRMLTNGWAKDSKGWCWIGPEGHMLEETMLVEYKGDTYYIVDGYMQTNCTVTINGVKYTFDENGKLVS